MKLKVLPKTAEQFINAGGSDSNTKQGRHDFLLRIPVHLMDKIEAVRKKYDVVPSRNHVIIALLEKALEQE